MKEQSFRVILRDPQVLTDEVVERLYGRCDDVTAGSSGGVCHVHFDRPGANLNEAIASAIDDLKACGLEADHIEISLQDLHQVTA